MSWSNHAWQSSDEDGDFRWRLSTFEEMGTAYNAWHFRIMQSAFKKKKTESQGESFDVGNGKVHLEK